MPLQALFHAGPVRQLRRQPAFSLLAASVLALGLGAALAIVEVADAVLLRPLPYPQEGQLVNAWQSDLRGGGARLTVTGADFLAWSTEATSGEAPQASEGADPGRPQHSFERMAAVSARGFNLLGADQPERIEGAVVSSQFFDVLGVAPLVGRAIGSGPPGPRAAVLSEALWRARFGGERAVVGRTISLDGEPVEVIGVMPAAFRYPPTAELWVSARTRVPEHPTYPIDPENDRDRHYLTVVARLRPSVSRGKAESELRLVQERLEREHPVQGRSVASRGAHAGSGGEPEIGVLLVPLRDQLFGSLRPFLLALLGVAALLLGVAWANVAHLFLARAATRAHEVAIRVALGATKASLWKLHFAEALLVCAVAAAAALVLAGFIAPALVAASPRASSLPAPGLSEHVAFTAATLLVLCGASLGLIGALHPVRTAESLQEGGRTGTGSRRSGRLRTVLVAFEIALSLVLLLGAGLLERSFRLLSAIDPGFDPKGVIAADLPLPRLRYPDARSQAGFAAELLRRLRADPQVEGAGMVSRLPLSPSNTVGDLALPGRESDAFPVDLRLASDGYAEALRIPLREGRTFVPADLDVNARRVAIVNESAARRAFPGRSALGERILVWGETVPSEVVGVVGNVHHVGLEAEPRPEAWRPLGAVGWSNLSVAVRGRGPVSSLAAVVRSTIWGIDRELPVVHLEPMEERVSRSLATRQFTLALLSSMALAAALLAAAGVYGVTSYLVAQRRRELGVRLALGATPGGIVRFVIGETMVPVAAGCALGLGAGAALSRFARGFLFGVAPLDPATFLLLPVLLAGAAAFATAAAAARAARVDPAEALRST